MLTLLSGRLVNSQKFITLFLVASIFSQSAASMTFQPGKKKIAVEITVMGKKQAEEELRPIRNARVILRRLDDTNSEKKRKTNNNGLAKMRITPGRIRVQVWAEGYEIWGEDQDLPAETEAKKEIKVVLIRSQ